MAVLDLFHEDLGDFASNISDATKKTFGIETVVANVGKLTNVPLAIDVQLQTNLVAKQLPASKNIQLFLTNRDLYVGNPADWIYGAHLFSRGFNYVSTLRLGDCAYDKLVSRVVHVALHEIGHGLVKSPHMVPAHYCDVRTVKSFGLGPHFTDNKCLMYEFITAAPYDPANEYLLLDGVKKLDASIDENLARLYSGKFCPICENVLKK